MIFNFVYIVEAGAPAEPPAPRPSPPPPPPAPPAAPRAAPSRFEPAGEIGGVAYINDSKATNVDSTWYALESMKRPVVWIAGGTDKGNDYEPLKRFAREKVHTLVCMGIDNRKLVESFTGIIPEIISTDSLDAAMQAARKASRPGDVVLLSPACASFDLFKNYENRGELFKQWVAEHAK